MKKLPREDPQYMYYRGRLEPYWLMQNKEDHDNLNEAWDAWMDECVSIETYEREDYERDYEEEHEKFIKEQEALRAYEGKDQKKFEEEYKKSLEQAEPVPPREKYDFFTIPDLPDDDYIREESRRIYRILLEKRGLKDYFLADNQQEEKKLTYRELKMFLELAEKDAMQRYKTSFENKQPRNIVQEKQRDAYTITTAIHVIRKMIQYKIVGKHNDPDEAQH